MIKFFKKKEKIKEKKIKEEKPSEVISEVKTSKIKEKKADQAYQIFKTPHVSEKATDLVKKNQYVFKIWPRTNKIEIKKAIENLYGIDVTSVKIIKIPRKKRRLGKISGWRKSYKKAIVKIKEGQKIEVLPR